MSAARVSLLVVAVAGLAALAYWGGRELMAPPPGDDFEIGDGEDVLPDLEQGERLEVVSAEVSDVYESFPGKISAEGRIPIRAPQGMRVAVTEIVKDEGDFVKQGDVVIRFNRPAIEDAIRKAVERGDEESAKRFRMYLEHADLRAEADGQVLEVYTELGRVPVDEGIPLMTLADRDSYKLRVQVPADATKRGLNIGAKVTVDLDANLGQGSGVVTGYEPASDGWTMLVIGMDPKEGLEQDLGATLRVPTSQRTVGLVPKSAVVQRGEVKVVRVWEPSDGSIAERTILTEGDRGDKWVVVAGVFPDESVVVPKGR